MNMICLLSRLCGHRPLHLQGKGNRDAFSSQRNKKVTKINQKHAIFKVYLSSPECSKPHLKATAMYNYKIFQGGPCFKGEDGRGGAPCDPFTCRQCLNPDLPRSRHVCQFKSEHYFKAKFDLLTSIKTVTDRK
jgi:hypothetical protein